MPARSTPFQLLVHHIQSQLTSAAEVEEKVMLPHRLTGTEREVDIVITAKVGEHVCRVGIECIEHGRPADVTWVEKMIAKHQHLDTHKRILVSLSGFSAEAEDVARLNGFETYTPDEARALDWTQLVGKQELFIARYDFTPIEHWLDIDTSVGRERIAAGGDTIIETGAARGTLSEVILGSLNRRSFGSNAMELLGETPSAVLDFDLHVSSDTVALDVSGNRHAVANIHVKARATRTVSPISLQALNWKGTPAAFGGGQTVLGKTMLSVIEAKPGSMSARIVADGRELELYPREDLLESTKA